MPVRRAATLILSLHDPFKHDEILMTETIRKKQPHTPHQVVHMQSHDIRTCKDTIEIRLQEIRSWKFPLCGCDGQKQIRKCAQPHLTTQIPTMLIQHRIILLVKTPKQHDAHEISQSISDDLIIPLGGLRIPCQYISSQTQTLPHMLSGEILAGQIPFI